MKKVNKKGFAEHSIKQLIWVEFDSLTQLVVPWDRFLLIYSLLEGVITPYVT